MSKPTRKDVMKWLFKELAKLDRELVTADRSLQARRVMLNYHKGRAELARQALRDLGLTEADIERELANRSR